MRVVVDTNVLVSFATRPNAGFESIFDFLAAEGILLVSEETLGELFDVLSRAKFRRYVPLEQCLDYVDWYAGISEQVIVTERVVACRDPRDDKFLSLAVSGSADCIVAGDRDLRDMASFNGIPIYELAGFIRMFVK